MNLTAETKKLKMSHHGNKSFQTQLSKDVMRKLSVCFMYSLNCYHTPPHSREKCTTMSNKKEDNWNIA